MATSCAPFRFLYLLIALHLLFFLILFEQHIVALSLLISYLFTLSTPMQMKVQLPSSLSTQSDVASPLVEEEESLQAEQAHPGEISVSAEDRHGESESVWRSSTRGQQRNPPHALTQSVHDLSGPGAVCVPLHEMAIAEHSAALRRSPPSCLQPYPPVVEAAREEEVVIVPCDVVVDNRVSCCRDSSGESSTTKSATKDPGAVCVHEWVEGDYGALASNSDGATPPTGWVWATAVVSLFSLCASIITWLFVSRCRTRNGKEVDCSPPSWAFRTAQRTALALLAGIRVGENGVRLVDFFFTVASLSLLGSLSIAQALCAALLRCGRRDGSSNCFEKTLSSAGVLLVKGFTLAPLSLLWIFTAGVGAGSVLGCVHVLLAVVLVLTYPRCVLSWRRRCWLLYVALLLLLWTVQGCFRLAWVHASLDAHAASPSPSTQRRFLVLWGFLPASASASADMGWRVTHAVGVWWAGAECVCLHTTTCAAAVAAPHAARTHEAALRRAHYARAQAAKEMAQLTRATELEMAAHRKVEELRFERGVGAAEMHHEMGRPHAADKSSCGLAPGSTMRRGGSPLNREELLCGRPHAPFGSCGSWHHSLDGRTSTVRSTKAFQRSSHSPCAGPALSAAAWSSSQASVMNSSLNSRYEPQDPRQHRTSWHRFDNSESTGVHDGSMSLAETAHASCHPTHSTADLFGQSRAAAHFLQESSDGECASSTESRRWGREPTRSPAPRRGESDGSTDALAHVPNAAADSPQCSPLLEGHRTTAAVPPSLSISAFAAPLLDTGEGEESLRRSQRVNALGNASANLGSGAHGASPLHSMTSLSLVGHSPMEHEIRSLACDSPPPVDTTALMMAETVIERRARAVEDTRKPQDEAAALGSPTQVKETRWSGACLESGSAAARPPRKGIRHYFSILQKMLKAYLRAHTLDLDSAEHEKLSSGPPIRSGALTGGFADATSSLRPDDAPTGLRESPLGCLLFRYLAQHWVWVWVLLSLLHFTISSTAVNLLPSLASLVYALLPQPWPPARYVRAQAIVVASSLLGKCLSRAVLVTAATPDSISWTAVRCLKAVLFRVRVSTLDADPQSASSGVRVSVKTWESWLDIMMSVVVLCAVMVQWTLVYPEACVLGSLRGGARADALMSHSTAAANELPEPSRQSCGAFLLRWNRHRRGAGADYYSMQLFFDILSLALFCWAYYAIAPQDNAPSQDNLFYAVQHNRLPGIFVATALGLVVVLFVERIIYVLHALAAKYVAHILLAVTYHALYLAWHVLRDDGDNRNGSSTPAAVALLLAAKLASLWCSALQLRHGYPLHRNHDPFTVKTDVVHWLGHMVFRTMPFLLELRVLLDWSFSVTSLKVQHWMLLEDIHHSVYRRFVDMHDLHWTSRHRGRRFPYYVRIYQGMLSFAAILLVLFFPLFWYSTFGPQVRANRVTAWSSEVAFSSFSAAPLFSGDAALSFISYRAAAERAFPASLLRFASARDTWQQVQPASCSSRMWSYTPAALDQLVRELLSDTEVVQMVVRSRVTRSRAAEAIYKTCVAEELYKLPRSTALTLARALESWQAADSEGNDTALPRAVSIALPSFYTPYVMSAASSVAAMASAGIPKADCILTLHREGRFKGFVCVVCNPITAGEGQALPTSFSASSLSSTPEEDDNLRHPIAYIVASPDVTTVQSSLSLIPNVGIIALYTSFILVISTYIRNFFAGDAHRVVLLQLANPEPIAELLRYIYLARSEASNGQPGNLLLEQLLFLELLDLLRSPERLLTLGGRRADDYSGEVYREALHVVTKRPFDLRQG